MSSQSRHRNFSGGAAGANSVENLPPRILSRISREVKSLFKDPPEGVRLVVDAESGLPSTLGEVIAELEGPLDTPYESKFFQLKLVLDVDFPTSPPRGFFLTKIYHPNVDLSTGAICVNTLKKDWTPDTTFSHVFSVIRCLLIIPFPESSLNDEAGKLFMESYEEFRRRARLMADVHGRCRPIHGNNGEERDESNKAENDQRNIPVRKSRAESNPLSNKNSNLKSSKLGAAKGLTGKVAKKKSLKRL